MRKNTSKKKKANKRHARGLAPLLAPVRRGKLRARGRPFRPGNMIGAATRFQKGAPSANPSGRPKNLEISRASREWLAAPTTRAELMANKLPLELEGLSHAEVVTYVRGKGALGGSLPDAAELADRAEGKPHTSVTVNEGPNPIFAFVESTDRLAKVLGPPEQPSLEEDTNK